MTAHDARPRLRVIQGGLALPAAQEDEPAPAPELERLHEEMAAAALLCDLLEQDGRRVAFDTPAPHRRGRVRARVVDCSCTGERGELTLARVVDPAQLTSYLEAS
ncbi:MAG: hypothetical protein QM679_05035 [Patulibacter sp.]